MDQASHAWIAIRAVALLEDLNPANPLVALLKPKVPAAAIGAWIPDKTDAKRGGGQTQHHVLKMRALPLSGNDRFVSDRDDLLGRLGGSPAIKEYLMKDASLSSTWWQSPYKAEPAPGQHLANRAMALSSMLRDLLIIGTPELDALLAGDVDFLKLMAASTKTQMEQAALYMFMLSHFVADASMPCHCDARKLAGYSAGLHKELEQHWSRRIGGMFTQKELLDGDPVDQDGGLLLKEARKVDATLGINFDGGLPAIGKERDVWLEMVDICRASFALHSVMVPPDRYPYADEDALAPFDTVFSAQRPNLLDDVDRVCLRDAVVNTAMIWTDVWDNCLKI